MYKAQYLCVSCMEDFRNSLFSATSILLSDGEERDQRGEPYSERQYNFIRKHLTKGSSEENLQKTELALRFSSLIALLMSCLSSRL